MATHDRPLFVELALELLLRQSRTPDEIIVADDSINPVALKLRLPANLRFIYFQHPRSLGEKLNVAAAQSSGDWIVKVDDDDYYGEDFIATLLAEVDIAKPDLILAVQPFLFFDLSSFGLYRAHPGWCAGSTLCFPRPLWQEVPFRDVWRNVDAEFFRDHVVDRNAAFQPLDALESFLSVRHGSHTWTHMPNGQLVADYIKSRPAYEKSASELLPSWVLDRYKAIRATTREQAVNVGH